MPPITHLISSHLNGRFFYLLLLVVLSLCACYAALVLNQATYAEVVAISRIPFHDSSYQYLPVRVSGHEFVRSQRIILGVALALLLATGMGLATAGGRQHARNLLDEIRRAAAGLGHDLATLTPTQRWAAGLSMGLLTGARIYFGIIKSYHSEEVASYDFFISRGWLAVTSFYPIPNNHVLPNTLSWLFFQVNPHVWFTLRLPVLITTTVGTVVMFAGLVRFGTFRAALIALTLFSWVQLSMYNAVAGRGYWLLMTLASVHFFATIALLSRPKVWRAAWTALLVSGILGCFTVPSFAYVVASAATYLGLVFLRRRDWRGIIQIGAVGAGILTGAALLYTPLFLVSGWRLLLANGYVVSKPWLAIIRQLPAFAWFTEGTLAGQRSIGALVFLATLAAFGWLLRASTWASLAPDLKAAVRRLGLPALWFVLLPYALLTLQRVLPPERVLLYKALYLFALLGLVVDAWLRAHPGRWWPRLTGAGIARFVAYQAYTMDYLVEANGSNMACISTAFTWLRTQPPGRVLIGVKETALHFLFFAHTRTPHRRWQFDTSPQPGARYRYVILPPNYQGPIRPLLPAQPSFHDGIDEIYVLPAGR